MIKINTNLLFNYTFLYVILKSIQKLILLNISNRV